LRPDASPFRARLLLFATVALPKINLEPSSIDTLRSARRAATLTASFGRGITQ
jgi:hypothetical protein